jgi:hypothetical protein
MGKRVIEEEPTQYQKHYLNMIEWFTNNMIGVKPLTLTREQYKQMSCDTIPESPLKEVYNLAMSIWTKTLHYAVSDTNQMFPAFIKAANELGKIQIIG